jgi:hypothetical protein
MVEVIRNKDNKTRQYPILIFGGFLMLADTWHTLYAGVRQHSHDHGHLRQNPSSAIRRFLHLNPASHVYV